MSESKVINPKWSPQCPVCLRIPMSYMEWTKIPREYKTTAHDRRVLMLETATGATILVSVVLDSHHDCKP